jgi:hypothetical protein
MLLLFCGGRRVYEVPRVEVSASGFGPKKRGMWLMKTTKERYGTPKYLFGMKSN